MKNKMRETKDCICMPLCVKHDCPRPCPICDKEWFEREGDIRRKERTIKEWEKTNKKKYDTGGMRETCLNCGKEACALACVGNMAGHNENNGCWIPIKH